MFDIHKIRKEFPFLNQKIEDKPIVYFDNAASTQKPVQVINKVREIYEQNYANVHRGNHHLAIKATEEYEKAREIVKNYINAEYSHEIIFTKNTTEAINLLAFSFGETFLSEGDEIIITEMEHHSNLVPWQLLAQRKNLKLKTIPITEDYQLDLRELAGIFTDKTKLLALTFVSNTLGTINNIPDIVDMAHSYEVPVFVDAAQAIAHIPVDVQFTEVDFLAFSGHKVYAETGIGVLYGKEEFLEKMIPYQSGGEMIDEVSIEKTTFNKLPYKFEAGTPNFVAAISLGQALEYLSNIGIQNIAAYEGEIYDYAYYKLQQIPDIELYTTKRDNKTSVISFNIKGIHHEDLGILLNKFGIAVRTGFHCTQPLMKKLNINGTVRVSFAIYNTIEEVDYFIESLEKAISMLK